MDFNWQQWGHDPHWQPNPENTGQQYTPGPQINPAQSALSAMLQGGTDSMQSLGQTGHGLIGAILGAAGSLPMIGGQQPDDQESGGSNRDTTLAPIYPDYIRFPLRQ
jgi:hypothetical protein